MEHSSHPRGAALVSYALLVGLIALSGVVAVGSLGSNVRETFEGFGGTSTTASTSTTAAPVGVALAGTVTPGKKNWKVKVDIDAASFVGGVPKGATVVGTWSDTGKSSSCKAGSAASCSVTRSGIPNGTPAVSFTVTSVNGKKLTTPLTQTFAP